MITFYNSTALFSFSTYGKENICLTSIISHKNSVHNEYIFFYVDNIKIIFSNFYFFCVYIFFETVN